MDAQEFDQRLNIFDGLVSVQSAGTHSFAGKEEPALAVTINGHIGPMALGRAIGSIVRAYLERMPPHLSPEEVGATRTALLLVINRGMHDSLKNAQMVSIQEGGAN